MLKSIANPYQPLGCLYSLLYCPLLSEQHKTNKSGRYKQFNPDFHQGKGERKTARGLIAHF